MNKNMNKDNIIKLYSNKAIKKNEQNYITGSCHISEDRKEQSHCDQQ